MRVRAMAVPLVAAACVGACSTADGAGAPAAPSPVPSASAPSTAPEPDEAACDDTVRDAAERTIAGQQRAFAAGDFDAAWRFASAGFRSGVDADGLRAIIERGYALLATPVELAFGECVVIAPGSAAIEVTARGASDARYLYVLAREGDRWLVDRVSGLPVEAPLPA